LSYPLVFLRSDGGEDWSFQGEEAEAMREEAGKKKFGGEGVERR